MLKRKKVIIMKRKYLIALIAISALIIIGILISLNRIRIDNNISTQKILNNFNADIRKSENSSLFYEFIPSNRYYDEINSTIIGDNLNNLKYEQNSLRITRTWKNSVLGELYIEFEFDLNEIDFLFMNSFILNGQIMGETNATGRSNVSIFIYDYLNSEFLNIYWINGTTEIIKRENGAFNCILESKFPVDKIRYDLINAGKMKFMVKMYSVVLPQSPANFFQDLSIFWFKLWVAKDVDVKQLEPINFVDLTSGMFHLTGNLNGTDKIDNNYLEFGTSNVAQYQTVICDFYIEYDLGIYAKENILGIIFSHLDWVNYNTESYYIQNPDIYIYNFSDDTEIPIQMLRADPTKVSHEVIPDIWYSNISICSSVLKNNSIIRIHYHAVMMNLDPNPAFFSVVIDLASIQIVRSIGPIIENINIIDDWVYYGEGARINGTIHAGKFQIDKVIIDNPYDVISNDEGFFEYTIFKSSAGRLEFFIEAIDIMGYITRSGPYYIDFHKRPVQIDLELNENPYIDPPGIEISISLKDALDLTPLQNAYFDLIVEKEDVLILEYRNLITDPSGHYSMVYPVNADEYLDTQYKFIVEVQEGYNTQFASTIGYITPTFAPCLISITKKFDNISEYWAGDSFNLIVEYHSLAEIDHAMLILNGTELNQITINEGVNEIEIENDRAGLCFYQISVFNNRGYSNISNTVEIYFKPNPIKILVIPSIDDKNRFIFLNITIIDLRKNSPIANIPIHLIIYDKGKLFWDSTLQATLPYTPIYIQFDLNDHNFTIFVIVNDTRLYAANKAKSINIPFDYRPYPFDNVLYMTVISVVCIGGFIFNKYKKPGLIRREE